MQTAAASEEPAKAAVFGFLQPLLLLPDSWAARPGWAPAAVGGAAWSGVHLGAGGLVAQLRVEISGQCISYMTAAGREAGGRRRPERSRREGGGYGHDAVGRLGAAIELKLNNASQDEYILRGYRRDKSFLTMVVDILREL
ncbi:hypothetical protein Celaphus_00009451 [Cervus elaphus hippelaphus]|uniref:Uncharacterized protein n=1 Tax=Cervus elaphus hippelaphus TaxID=46360 RepID=A0A212C159_CEREH|nr:hypothetical protein Celaphus_00009451 [Cervus elaphus hippelaphus]